MMNYKKNIISTALITSVFLIIFSCDLGLPKNLRAEDTQAERIDGILDFLNPEGKVLTSITIEIAETFLEQRNGLMYRSSLSKNHGMLFFFKKTGIKSFWMRNTQIPLDIFFIDKNGLIVHLVENTTPYSEKSIPSVKPVKYVLEVNSGFADKYHITSGCSIRW